MKNAKNEQGYALLLVLLVIVFITILTAVFLRSSISNAKQEGNTDTSHLTYVAAEAGVDYYKTLYSNQYYESVKDIEESAKKLIQDRIDKRDKKSKDPTTQDYEEARKHAASLLKAKLETIKDTQNSSKVIKIDDSYVFVGNDKKLATITVQSDNITVLVSGSVIGRNVKENKERTLSFTQSYLLPSFDPADWGGQGVATSGNGDWTYPGHGATKECKDTTKIEGKICVSEKNSSKIKEIDDKSTVYFPVGNNSTVSDFEIEKSKVHVKGDFNLSKGELEVENSLMTVEGSVIAKKEIEIDNSKFYVKGFVTSEDEIEIEDSDVNIGSNVYAKKEIEIEDSKVKIGGSLTTDDELEVEDSNVEVGGTLTVAKDLELEKSTMIVRGSASLKGKVEIEKSYLYIDGALNSSGSKFEVKDNSKVCVSGKLTIPGKTEISSNSIVYHRGDFAYSGGGTVSNRIKQLNSDEFKKECPVTPTAPSTPEEVGIKWPSPSLDVEYK